MKTEVSIPKAMFEAAQQLAQDLDMSLSELYTAAIAAYVTAHQNTVDVTQNLDLIYEAESSTLEPELVALQMASISEDKW
ncbi:MAG: ChpI protein [Okeania sp. SIO3B3]|nr:ChpI protein [Okeania sp. SIO3B3]